VLSNEILGGRKMIVKSTEIQNNFGKYLELANGQEIVITKNGLPVARLLGMKDSLSFLTDRLVGIIPPDVDEDEIKSERLAKR
jgi:prevent-host-death family protein